MPPKKTATTEEGAPNGLTDGELRFIKAIFDNMTQKPDADWDAVATTLGLKDAKCAKERFRQMSVRHGWREGSGTSASPRKTAAAAGDKVTKKRAPRKKSAAAIKKAEEDEEAKEEVKEEVKAEEKKEVKSEDADDEME